MIQDLQLISFSGGRTSAFMTNELLKDADYSARSIICFCNTGKENEATLKFVEQCNQLWGGRVVWLEYDSDERYKVVDYATASRQGEPFEQLIRKRKFVPNVMVRFCTQELKIRVIKYYLVKEGYKHWTNVIGIRYDEPRRYNKTKEAVQKQRWEVDMPLVRWRITKADVLAYWKNMPFDLNLKEYEGNCDLCFLKGKGKKLLIIRETPHKSDWWQRMEQIAKGSFKKAYSYTNLKEQVMRTPELFDDINQEPDFECFCNSD